jgi:uracil-DNA glycosylase family 4
VREGLIHLITELDRIHRAIGVCTVCASFTPLQKHPSLERGNTSAIMAIGQAPGNRESKSGVAFSGGAGKRLMRWLIDSGIGQDEMEVRTRVYFTSLIKCQAQSPPLFSQMFANCRHFLVEQLQAIRPKIVIPLGPKVFNALFNTKYTTRDLIGKAFLPEDLLGLFTTESAFQSVKKIIPFPHPSGRNLSLNLSKTKSALELAKISLKSEYLELTP